MEIVTKKFVEELEPRRGRSFSDSEIAKALDGVEFPARIQVLGVRPIHFAWNWWDRIVPNGDKYEGARGVNVVEGFNAASYEEAHNILSTYENEYNLEHPEDRVEVEWSIPEEGISVQYSYWTDKFGRGEEKTKISFPDAWGSRRQCDKARWLRMQDEVRSTPYLLRALEAWRDFGDWGRTW